MNPFVALQLQHSIAQHGAGTHDQWRGYMTIIVVNHGIRQSISMPTVVIRPMMKCDVDKPWDSFLLELKWTLSIRSQVSTLSTLDLVRVHYIRHALLQDKDTHCLPEGNQ
jgi:hypothetical protein